MAEARRIGRYLLGRVPPQELLERYRAASLALFPEPPDDVDQALLRFVEHHPWSLPALESALGLVRPRALLRRKIVVMLAILETDPRLADRFEPLCPGRSGAAARLLATGLRSVAKAAGGLLLYPLARLTGRGTPQNNEPSGF